MSAGAQSQLRELLDAVDDVLRALARARADVWQVGDAAGMTIARVEEELGGTATAADREMVDALGTARGAARTAVAVLEEAETALHRAMREL